MTNRKMESKPKSSPPRSRNDGTMVSTCDMCKRLVAFKLEAVASDAPKLCPGCQKFKGWFQRFQREVLA